MSATIEVCPFCGKQAIYQQGIFFETTVGEVVCVKCGAKIQRTWSAAKAHEGKRQLILDWNTRTRERA